MASYTIIAKQISWGGDFDFQDYHGEAVVSEEAFFLVIQQHVFDAFTDLSEGPLGLLGRIVGFGARDLECGLASRKTLCELNLTDLPAVIARDANWPIKAQDEARIIVVPRGSVERLYFPWWGPLKVYTENFVFCLQPHFFFRGSTLRVLRGLGWKI